MTPVQWHQVLFWLSVSDKVMHYCIITYILYIQYIYCIFLTPWKYTELPRFIIDFIVFSINVRQGQKHHFYCKVYSIRHFPTWINNYFTEESSNINNRSNLMEQIQIIECGDLTVYKILYNFIGNQCIFIGHKKKAF